MYFAVSHTFPQPLQHLHLHELNWQTSTFFKGIHKQSLAKPLLLLFCIWDIDPLSLLSLGFLLPAELWWTPAVGFEHAPSHHTPLITIITQLDPAGPMESNAITDLSSFIFGKQLGANYRDGNIETGGFKSSTSSVLMKSPPCAKVLSVVLWPSGKLT